MTNDEIYKRIMVMDSIKAATSFINSCEITKSDLNKLCKRHNILIVGKATKEEIVARFIQDTLGVKLKNKAKNRYNTK